ncbi:hypothetical protein V5T82_02605 [Magnetovibrio sp. PR-2]|uniref:hypothetical protein n=1 Tax=Magnetovibrio sp. PR-2 TaxID=3120356 RepID=UPI002FCE1B13
MKLNWKNPRLIKATAGGALSIVDLVVFISCLRVEDTNCTAITGLIGLALMVFVMWNGLIYIAQHRARM